MDASKNSGSVRRHSRWAGALLWVLAVILMLTALVFYNDIARLIAG